MRCGARILTIGGFSLEKERLAALAERVKSGDGKAMDEIFSATAQQIYYYCQKVTGDSNPDVLLNKIYNFAESNINSLSDGGDVLMFIRIIAARFCAEKTGIKGIENDCWNLENSEGLPEVYESESDEVTNLAVYSEKVKRVIPHMMEELNACDRFCAYSYYCFSLSEAEIGEIADVAEENVRARLKAVKFGIKTNIKFYANIEDADSEDMAFSRRLIQSYIYSDIARYPFTSGRNEDVQVEIKYVMPKHETANTDSAAKVRYDRRSDDELLKYTYDQQHEEENKKKSNKSIIFIIIAVVLGIGIIVGAVFAIKAIIERSNPAGPSESTSETTPVETVKPSVSFDVTQIKVKVGESVKLKAEVKPDDLENKEIIWRAQDDSIIKVDSDGTVTGLKVGSSGVMAALYYLDEDDNVINAQCLVTVYEEVAPITDIKISENSVHIYPGDTYTILTTVTPEASKNEITFTSSNPSIAVVDSSGNVMALSVGNSLITISSKNSDKTAWFSVFVDEKTINVSEIKLKSDKVTVKTDEVFSVREYFDVLPVGAANPNVRYECTVSPIVENSDMYLFPKEGAYFINIISEENPKIYKILTVIVEK